MSTSRSLPTSAGSMCSKVCASARTPAACSPALCAKACLPTYGCAGSGARLSSSSTKCAVSVRRASRSGASSSQPIFSCRSAMIVTRFALPVRSPMPLIVPCTCVAPASTAVSVLATAQPESSWVWIPSGDAGQRFADDRERGADLRRQRAAVGVAQHEPLGARVGGRAQAVERVAGVEREAVEEVLGVEQHALARADAGRRPSRRSSRGSPRARRARPSRRAAPRPCRRACRPARSESARTRSPSSCSARDVAPARHPEGDDLGGARAARPASSSNSSLLLRVRRREAGLDHVHAELVERVHDAQLLLGGERQAAAAHAVAQGGVVELYVGHRAPSPRRSVCGLGAAPRRRASRASTGCTTSSHSR